MLIILLPIKPNSKFCLQLLPLFHFSHTTLSCICNTVSARILAYKWCRSILAYKRCRSGSIDDELWPTKCSTF